jgi:hypothetical protein
VEKFAPPDKRKLKERLSALVISRVKKKKGHEKQTKH